MLTEYRRNKTTKAPGPWYSFTYDNGQRVTQADFQGPEDEIEEFGRQLSREKGREVRVRVHQGKVNRIHAIFNCRGGRYDRL